MNLLTTSSKVIASLSVVTLCGLIAHHLKFAVTFQERSHE